MKKSLMFLLVLMMCVLFIPTIQAKNIGHFYAKADENVIFEDDVNGSSALAGQSIESKGSVHGVNFLAGNKVEHTGQSDYLVLAGNSILVSGVINNDSIIAGNVIEIDREANLKRDVVILGSDVNIRGNLNRNVIIYGGRVSIDGASISGNVKIYAEEIKVNDESIIGGSLSYPADANASIGSNITNIIKTEPIQGSVAENFKEVLMGKVWSILSLLLIFAIFTLIMPKVFEKINDDYNRFDFSKGVETFAKGLVFLILVPLFSLFLLIIPFGISLSLIMIALYFIIIYLSKIFAAYLLGYKLWQKLFKTDTNILLVGILGLALLFVLDFIPGINFLVSFLTLLLGIGIIFELLFDKKVKN